jgi:hypothetical protein
MRYIVLAHVKGCLMFFLLLGDRDQLLIAQPMDEKEFREN